jgi:hypothetical protein
MYIGSANSAVYTTNSSGFPVISQTLPSTVQGNITSVGTISSGTWSGTAIAANKGGTGLTAADAYAIICGGTTDGGTFQTVAGGATGTYLQGAGDALPVYSTATLPSTATGTGTILRADGTNWVASTPTFPNAAAQGDLLYASATSVWSQLAKDTNATRSLTNTGSSNSPAWAQVALATGVSGTLPLANGGTNAALTADTGAIAYSSSTAIALLASTATANKLLVSGASAAPTWSTPTFPNASATTRKIIVSDGTNWVASTETYAVPGTSGNVLTSDGTNWTSAAVTAGGGLLSATLTLTSAQIKALHATGIQLVAAQGSGKVIALVAVWCKFNYGGSNAFTSGFQVSLNYGSSSSNGNICTLFANAQMIGTVSVYNNPVVFPISNILTQNINVYENLGVFGWNSSATEFTGNAANNNTVTMNVLYYVITL